jgi:hypothetical protein
VSPLDPPICFSPAPTTPRAGRSAPVSSRRSTWGRRVRSAGAEQSRGRPLLGRGSQVCSELQCEFAEAREVGGAGGGAPVGAAVRLHARVRRDDAADDDIAAGTNAINTSKHAAAAEFSMFDPHKITFWRGKRLRNGQTMVQWCKRHVFNSLSTGVNVCVLSNGVLLERQ